MISVDEARDLVLARLPGASTEEVPFRDALGRVLAAALDATTDLPSFDRAVMDGYALRADDARRAPVELELVGEVRTGQADPGSVRAGQCVYIMTGAAVPAGADSVEMVENTRREGRRVTILRAVEPGTNISPRGSEAAAGETILESGRLIGPAETAVLATFGHVAVRVFRRPRVAVLATGDELVEVEARPGAGEIRNSNAYSLEAQLRQLGVFPDLLGIARDDRTELRRKIIEGLERDVLILTGGVSAGEYDFVKGVLEESGVSIVFAGVAMKPGKPTVFATRGDRLVFGLPGNPVSTFVAFENFVRPAVGRLCGFKNPDLPRVEAELLFEVRQVAGRTTYLPAQASMRPGGWEVRPLRWKGSADVVGFSRVDALLILPGHREVLRRGEAVSVLLLPDYFHRRMAGEP